MKTSLVRVFTAPLAIATMLLVLSPTPRAYAVNKDMVQLQTQMSQLQEAVARLETAHTRDTAVLNELLRQMSDAIRQMNSNVGDMQKRVQAVSETQTGKTDQISSQIQSMNDSIDEMKARLSQFDKTLGTIQSQQQSMAANVQNLASANPAGGSALGGGMPTTAGPGSAVAGPTAPAGPTVDPNPPATARPVSADAPSAKDLYATAYKDYNGAKFTLAEAEFNDLVRFYPTSELAGSAYYYLGEIAFRAQRYQEAIKSYDKVIELASDTGKIRAAHLHKADSLAKLKQNPAAAREYRALMSRFPGTPEAHAAQLRLPAVNR